MAAFNELLPATEAWLRNDARLAMAKADAVASTVESLPREARAGFAIQLSYLYSALGALRRAEQMHKHIEPRQRRMHDARTAAARHDVAALRTIIEQQYSETEAATQIASLLVEAGWLHRARSAVALLKQRDQSRSYGEFVEAQVALAEGRPAAAIPGLRSHLAVISEHAAPRMPGATKLAEALAATGDVTQAISTLEEASSLRLRLVAQPPNMGAGWVLVQDKLAQLYRRAGRTGDAEKTESELMALLELADADHPIKQRIVQRRSSARQ